MRRVSSSVSLLTLSLLAACAGPGDNVVKSNNEPPTVTLLSPTDGSRFDPASPVEVCGTISDETDLEELDITLFANDVAYSDYTTGCSGDDSVGFSLELDATEWGLRLAATDSSGDTGEDTVTILPEENRAPTCTFVEPTAGSTFLIGDLTEIIIGVTDPDEIDLSALSGVLTTDQDPTPLWEGSPDSTGQIIASAATLQPATHVLTLTVVDRREASDTCSTTFTLDGCLDLDGDGFDTCEDDCDDNQAAAFPDNPEIGDGVDNNCDGTIDEGTELFDDDGDGFSELTGDCDDDDAAVFPGADETWYDGIDGDCAADGDFDQDGDGFDHLSYGGDDCDDLDGAVHPGARETWYDGVDQDCAGDSDYDQDGDGLDADSAGGADCDDTNPAVLPGAADAWYDGLDANCDGASDYDQDADGQDAAVYGGLDCDDVNPSAYAGGAETWYDGVDGDCSGGSDYDQDLDGFLDRASGGTDCVDTDSGVYPGATEIWYDGVDQDCDAADDLDQDGDGDYRADDGGTDCDDTDAAVYGGATEIWYDGIDQDCAGGDDYDQDGDTHVGADFGGDDCNDLDADTYPGAPEDPYDGRDTDCDSGEYDQDGDGYLSDAYGGLDCDDTDPTVNPDTVETFYDGLDSDCDGLSDFDADVDGHDSVDAGGDDCDDTNRGIYGGAADAWYDGIDSDCNGSNDYDQDGDGALDPSGGGDDCADRDATIYPAAADTWYDGIDQNCDGADDYDQDADGYRTTGTSIDCDDTDPSVNPGILEVWYDGVDADCGGGSDYDQDRDGQDREPEGDDCDDRISTTYTGATETWYDGIDGDCDGGSDYDRDADGFDSDQYGGTDCDDLDLDVNPDAAEIWYDGIDGDCDEQNDFDQDGDGYTSETYATPSGSYGTDCFDAVTDSFSDLASLGPAAVNPAVDEVFYDGTDADCDGASDYDADGDGFDANDYGGTDCYDSDELDPDFENPVGFSPDDVRPTASETYYDGTDENCDGLSDYDRDFDSYDSDTYGGTDCDDSAITVHPGATESRDAVDNDCDTDCDEGLLNEGDVVITEIMKDPCVGPTNSSCTVTDANGEWFEIYNNSGQDIRICNWTVYDLGGNTFDITSEILLEAGDFAVIGRSTRTSVNGNVTVDYAYATAMDLGNSDDEVILEEPGGVILDEVYYDDAASNPFPDVFGKSLSFDWASMGSNAHLDNDLYSNWCVGSAQWVTGGDYGSPGAANPACP